MKNKFKEAAECLDDGKSMLGLGVLYGVCGAIAGGPGLYLMGGAAALSIILGLGLVWAGCDTRREYPRSSYTLHKMR